MTTAVKKTEQPKKISKLAKAIKKGSLKGAIVELVDDPWDLKLSGK